MEDVLFKKRLDSFMNNITNTISLMAVIFTLSAAPYIIPYIVVDREDIIEEEDEDEDEEVVLEEEYEYSILSKEEDNIKKDYIFYGIDFFHNCGLS